MKTKPAQDKPCIYCGDPSHEATAPSATCIAYLKRDLDRLKAIEEAAQAVTMDAHNILTALERFGNAGGFHKLLKEKNTVLWAALAATPESARHNAQRHAEYVGALEKVAELARPFMAGDEGGERLAEALAALDKISQ